MRAAVPMHTPCCFAHPAGSQKAGAGGSAVDLPDGGTAPEVAITLPPDSLGGGTLGLLHPLGALFPSFEPEALPLAGTPGP